MHVQWTFPGNEQTDIPLRQGIRVQFDRFLAPEVAVRQGICIESSTVGSPEAGDRCLGGALAGQYDPVDRVAVWTPLADLMPNTRYNVRILVPASDDDPGGIRAFDGAPLESEYTFAFVTGDGSKPAVEPNRAVGFCDVPPQVCALPRPSTKCKVPRPTDGAVPGPFRILQTCTDGSVSCHGSAPTSGFGQYGGTLQLESVDDIRKLVDLVQVATETAVAANPNVAQRSVRSTFGENMPYIDPTNPGNSYLLYKVMLAAPPRCPIRDEESANNEPTLCEGSSSSSGFSSDLYDCAAVPDGGPTADGGCAPPPLTARKATKGALIPTSVEPWVPEDQWNPPVAGEYARLKQRIRGEPMPFGGGISPRNLAETLSAWIYRGALVSDCTAP